MRILYLLGLSLMLVACSADQSFEVEGRVAGFGDDPKTLIVEHKEIEGYMPAMTMPFRAVDSASIGGLETGDPISFQLHVTSDSSWIDTISPLPEDAVPVSPAGDQIPRPSADEREVLDPGDEVPDFTLINERNEEISKELFANRPYVVTFIYTRCPLPDYCPLMSQRFVELQNEIEEHYNGDIGLLSITVDPDYDTPEVLREYAEGYNANPNIWMMATGDSAEVEAVATRFGVYYRDREDDVEEVIHNLSTAVVTPDGVLHEVWRGTDWSTDEVLAAVEEIR